MSVKKHPLYQVWKSMWRRCTTKTDASYRHYGGRGISVCKRWRDFHAFALDMGPRPNGRSIDRINNDGNYEPSNCRWATNAQQMRNTRANNMLTRSGETMCLSDWAARLGLHQTALSKRIARHGVKNVFTASFHLITFKGETMRLSEWADRLNMDYRLIWRRLTYGWPLEIVLTKVRYPRRMLREYLASARPS